MFNALQSNGTLHLDTLKCLRAAYLYNTCSHCAQICPADALSLANNQRFALDTQKCINCNACVGVCPTEAIATTSFDPNIFTLKFSATDETLLSCKKNTPCLRIFNVEQWIALGLRNEVVVCDMAHCEGCEINLHNTIQTAIVQSIDEANRFLDSIGANKAITKRYEKIEAGRRELFKRFAKEVHELQEDICVDEIFDTHASIPVHRQLLLHSLKKQIKSIPIQRLATTFGFTQNKTIAFSRCDNCGDCVQFCPTHALQYSDDHTKIFFATTQCIACGICDDICKPKAFGVKEELDLVSMAFGRFETLIEHHFEICSECKVSFPQKNNETVCNRCRDFVEQNALLFVMAKDM